MSLPQAEQDLWVGTNTNHLPEWKVRKSPGEAGDGDDSGDYDDNGDDDGDDDDGDDDKEGDNGSQPQSLAKMKNTQTSSWWIWWWWWKMIKIEVQITLYYDVFIWSLLWHMMFSK